MFRTFASAAATFAWTLSLVATVSAAPDLVASDSPGGWTLPALPRSSGDATAGNCQLQAPALPGESASTWFNGSMHNIGTNTATGTFTALYLDDGLRTIQGAYNVLPLGFGTFVNNPSSVTIKGGRHTLLSRADVFNGVAETNEMNNDWARSYIWSPLALTPGVSVTRSGDPLAWTTGTGPWPNSEGFSGTTVSGHWWYAFATVGTQAGSDFDMMLHPETPTNIPQAGFGTYSAWSNTQYDHTDLVIVNRNVAPAGTYYAGVHNWAGVGNKVVQFEMSPDTYFQTPGVYGPFTMGANDIVDLHEIYGFTSDNVQIEIRPLSGDANVGASLIGTTSGGVATIYNNLLGGLADGTTAGTRILWVNMAANTFHGLVLFKHDSSDIPKTLTYEIIISSAPNFTANHTYFGWWGPIIPRNAQDATLPLDPSPTLNGNQATTSFNYTVWNQGPGDAPAGFSNVLFVDDQGTWDSVPSSPIPHSSYGYFTNTPIGGPQSIVRGGRHHLRVDDDTYNQIDELWPYETDNTFTDWFVWSPLNLVNQVPVLRAAPPTRQPQGWGPYESCDGFRIPGFEGYYWTAVAMIPTSMSADYDVRLHTPSTGSRDGFGDWLTWSADPFPGNPDFCIVNYNAAPGGPVDASVTNWSGSNADCYVQVAEAPYRGIVGPSPGVTRYGPFTLDAHDCLDIHEFFIYSDYPVWITANNLSGNVDLEIRLYDPTAPYHMKGTYMAFNNATGPGGDEQIGPINLPASSYYAVVVSKSKATDVNNAATYELVVSTQGNLVDAPAVGAPLPREFALSMPRPNPTSAGTSVELAVPASGGRASVAVYDVTGRRVRSLVDGEAAPGRRLLTWDGLDASGKRAAAGVYFVKLEAPHAQQTQKVTLLR